ncbi:MULTISPECIES: symporter small accessory protein [Thiorhodovibrio]|uniref:Uncharacterized protein n=1 Tax=Thiorhodovibrio frisius TaxID=631362 RepID=H8YXC6_9GAMM|nr:MULTISPECIES: symporter small accessory protein [Thiorhodovibrio]EIC23102.1 hypothetical protein Thi970DRAFT_00754 [Thiorhodovibrio frisius]WPL13767.1 hypothetical protein Thiosp_03584 [Thiorhodovibrio litoralis]WPL22634.1 hypothetical protein Thiofri_02801 [Thiorhodovibrio frisius]
MLGIPDPWVATAYLGCILMAIVSLIYGLVRRNAAPDEITPVDRDWAIEERKADHDL